MNLQPTDGVRRYPLRDTRKLSFRILFSAAAVGRKFAGERAQPPKFRRVDITNAPERLEVRLKQWSAPLRDECLNQQLFVTVADAEAKLVAFIHENDNDQPKTH